MKKSLSFKPASEIQTRPDLGNGIINTKNMKKSLSFKGLNALFGGFACCLQAYNDGLL
jgi:hypothetical protein